MDTREKILEFFKNNKKADGLTYDTELFKGNYVNSLFALQMVMFIEKEFRIKLKHKDINEKNFHTINAIAELVEGVLAGN